MACSSVDSAEKAAGDSHPASATTALHHPVQPWERTASSLSLLSAAAAHHPHLVSACLYFLVTIDGFHRLHHPIEMIYPGVQVFASSIALCRSCVSWCTAKCFLPSKFHSARLMRCPPSAHIVLLIHLQAPAASCSRNPFARIWNLSVSLELLRCSLYH